MEDFLNLLNKSSDEDIRKYELLKHKTLTESQKRLMRITFKLEFEEGIQYEAKEGEVK